MEKNERITYRRLLEPQDYLADLARGVRSGMTAKRKWFPTKFMYSDEEAAALFEQIAMNASYYVLRAEMEILSKHAKEILRHVAPNELVELGSGSVSTKTRLLLEAMHSAGCYRYVPLDISETALRHAAKELSAEYEWLLIDGYLADFDADLNKLPRNGRRLTVFLCNTVGNFRTKGDRHDFLKKLSATMTAGDAVLLGIDLLKDAAKIMAGYVEESNYHQRFSKCSLTVMNRELGANFQEENFKHCKFWNPDISSLEFVLVAQQEMRVSIHNLQLDIEFTKGEDLQLGVSTKFTKDGITQELTNVGLSIVGWYTDSAEQYAMLVAVPNT